MSKWYQFNAALMLLAASTTANAGSVDLGDASGYTLVIKNDFQYATGDVQGFSAIGGDVVSYSGQADYFEHQVDLFGIETPEMISDFTQTFDYLSGLSDQLAGYSSTGTTNVEWGTLEFKAAQGSENQDVHIFDVDFEQLASAHTIKYSGIESGQIIVNVNGDSASTLNFGGQYFEDEMLNYLDNSLAGRVASDIMFNFNQVTDLNLSQTLYASVLAPNSNITAQGAATFWGQIIANSWSTTHASQFNYDLFANVVDEPVVEVSEPRNLALFLFALLALTWRQYRLN